MDGVLDIDRKTPCRLVCSFVMVALEGDRHVKLMMAVIDVKSQGGIPSTYEHHPQRHWAPKSEQSPASGVSSLKPPLSSATFVLNTLLSPLQPHLLTNNFSLFNLAHLHTPNTL